MSLFSMALRGLWKILRGIPWQAWVAVALALVVWRYGEARYDAGVADCREAVAAADAKASEAARAEERRQSDASAAATRAKDERLNEKLPAIKNRTHEATERIRIVYRDRPVPAECKRPDGVREELEAARRRANAAAGELRRGAGSTDSADPRGPGAGG